MFILYLYGGHDFALNLKNYLILAVISYSNELLFPLDNIYIEVTDDGEGGGCVHWIVTQWHFTMDK